MKLPDPLYRRETPDRFDLARTITVRGGTINESAHTYDVVLATEGRVRVYDWRRGQMIEEVLRTRGAQLVPQVSLLDSHQRWSIDAVLGSIRNLRVEQVDGADALVATVHADVDDEDGRRAWNKVKNGHVREISVGYSTEEYVDISPGEEQTIDGQIYRAGQLTLRISTKWTPREGSLVPVGADPNAVVRHDPNPPSNTESIMNRKLRKYLERHGLPQNATEEQAWAFYGRLEGERHDTATAIRANPDAFNDNFERINPTDDGRDRNDGGQGETPNPPTTHQRSAPPNPAPATIPPAPPSGASGGGSGGDPGGQRSEAELERERILTIQGLPGAREYSDVVQRCVADPNCSADTAARRILEAQRGARDDDDNLNGRHGYDGGGHAPAAHTRTPGRNEQRSALIAGLCLRMGTPWDALPVDESIRDEDQRRQAQERAAASGERYQHASLMDMCRHALQLEGRQVPHDPDEMVRAAVSTSTMTHMFETSINASVGREFDMQPDTTGWCETREVSNFQQHKDILVKKLSKMEELPRGGSAKDAEFSDQAETFEIARYAEQFTLDERDIIDDRFDIISDMPTEIATSGAELVPDLVYSVLLGNGNLADGVAIFHANHGNLKTGGGSALGAAGLQAAITAMGEQRRNGRPLNVRAVTLLVPHALRFTARQLTTSAEMREAASANGTRNPLLDENLRVVSESRIGANGVVHPGTLAALTGSDAAWYLVAGRRTIAKVFLRGRGRRPRVRASTLMQGKWGINFDANFDIGAYPRDYVGMVKNNGS